jgi:hypothetical protein
MGFRNDFVRLAAIGSRVIGSSQGKLEPTHPAMRDCYESRDAGALAGRWRDKPEVEDEEEKDAELIQPNRF